MPKHVSWEVMGGASSIMQPLWWRRRKVGLGIDWINVFPSLLQGVPEGLLGTLGWSSTRGMLIPGPTVVCSPLPSCLLSPGSAHALRGDSWAFCFWFHTWRSCVGPVFRFYLHPQLQQSSLEPLITPKTLYLALGLQLPTELFRDREDKKGGKLTPGWSKEVH